MSLRSEGPAPGMGCPGEMDVSEVAERVDVWDQIGTGVLTKSHRCFAQKLYFGLKSAKST